MIPERPLKLLCWEGYDHPKILSPFTRRSGVEVQARTLISDAQAAQALLDEPIAHDILNINNAYVAKCLHPAGRIATLDAAQFEDAFEQMLPQFKRLYRWTRSLDGSQLIGVCQRFGAFNLVINTDLISRTRAQDEGFALADEAGARYGILRYDDFNIFHVCIAAGINPFVALNPVQMQRFEDTARRWFERATLTTSNHHELNRALVEKRIGFYLSGGVYTASPARLDGHLEIEAITPRSGPIDGLGGIVFTEITSALAHQDPHPLAQSFLGYLLEPDTAIRIAFIDGTCNPVAQMGNPAVMAAFRKEQLAAIQWDTLEEDIAYCADYDIVPDHDALLNRLHAAAEPGLSRGGASQN